jgi:hypothetical protein
MASFRRLLLLAGFPTLLAVAHCGGESSGLGGGGSTGTPLSDVPGLFTEAVCDTASKCYGPLLTTVLGGNSCVGFLTKQIQQGDFALMDDAVASGTVHYDGTKVSACLDALRQKGCSIFTTRIGTVCSDVLSGTVAAGKSCTFGAECTTGLFCDTTTCPGVCTSLLAENSPCRDSDNCQDGLDCSTPPGSSSPQKICRKPTGLDVTGAAGAACDPQAAKLCQDGLFCAAVSVVAGGPTFQCETSPSSGCHVAFPEECPEGQFCVLTDAQQSLVGACTPIPKAGETCGKPSPGDSRNICAPGTTCDSAGKCVAFQDLGGSCTADNQCYSKNCGTAGDCVPSKCAN